MVFSKVFYLGAGMVAAALIVAVVLTGLNTTGADGNRNTYYSAPNDGNPHISKVIQQGPEKKLTFADLSKTGAATKGNPNANITIVDFSDFQCTNCRRFATITEPQIEKDYIETDKVNLVFVHFPVFGPDSETAAMASECANDQGKFWEFHDLLYKNQGAENSGWADPFSMKDFASQLGLDKKQFGACLDDGKYNSQVQSDLALALSLDFPGTPSFLIMKSDGSDPEKIVGAQPYMSFKAVIDKKIK